MCVTARESVAKRHARIPTSRAASATATANHERMLSVAASWFNSSVSGYCEPTERKGDPQLVCLSGARKGYWTLTANESAAWPAAVETCLAYCRACPSCAYLSVSPADQECSFFASCDLGALQTRLSASYRSGAVLAASAEAGASWEAELDAAELDAAISPSDEIACALRRLRRSGRSPSVAILGSSITSGRGKHGRALTPYGTLLPRLLPWSPGNVSAYGYPGASLMYLAACLRRFLPQHDADVYVIEVVDNMMIGGKEAHREVQDAITHIIEELRARKRRNSGDAAVVVLLPLPQSCVAALRAAPPYGGDMADMADIHKALASCLDQGGGSLASAVEQTARETGVAVASMRLALASRLRVAVRAGHTALGRLLDTSMDDKVHPNGVGHAWLAQLLARLLATASRPALVATAAGPPTTPCASAHAARLVNRSRRTSAFLRSTAAVCAFGDELQPLVRSAQGWHFVEEPAGGGHTKPGFVSFDTGARLDVCFSPPRSAVHRGETFEWQLAYLQSYDSRMGSARGQCVDGCACRDATWHGRIARRVSQPAMGKLTNIRVSKEGGGNGSCPCVIRITSIGGEAPQAAAKFKIVAVMSGFFTYRSIYAYRSSSASLVDMSLGAGTAARL